MGPKGSTVDQRACCHWPRSTIYGSLHWRWCDSLEYVVAQAKLTIMEAGSQGDQTLIAATDVTGVLRNVPGGFFLCDMGGRLTDFILTPFRATRYHLKVWRRFAYCLTVACLFLSCSYCRTLGQRAQLEKIARVHPRSYLTFGIPFFVQEASKVSFIML